MSVILIVGFIVSRISLDNRILWLAIALCASKNLKFQTIAKITFWTTLLVSGCVIFFSFIMDANIVITRKGGFSLGLGHPNIVHGIFMLLCSLYIYLNWNNISILKCIVLEVLNLFFYQITLSRSGMLSLSGMIVMIIIFKLLSYYKSDYKKKILSVYSIIIFIIIVTFSILPILYNLFPDSILLITIDSWLTGRLWQGSFYLDLGGINLFGNYFSELNTSTPVAYLDMGFFRILVEYGIISYFLIIIGYIKAIREVIEKDEYGLFFMMASMLFFTCIESLGTYVFFNITFLYFTKFLTFKTDKKLVEY